MVITLMQLLFVALVLVAGTMVVHSVVEGSRRRDREMVRRLQRYLDQLPPARPW